MYETFSIWKHSPNEAKEKMNRADSIKRGLEEALTHIKNENTMKRMLRFAIEERRYIHKVMITSQFEHVFETYAERWLEARFICKSLINIYRRGSGK